MPIHFHSGLRRPQRLLLQRDVTSKLNQVHPCPDGLERPQHPRHVVQVHLPAKLFLQLQPAKELHIVLLRDKRQQQHRHV